MIHMVSTKVDFEQDFELGFKLKIGDSKYAKYGYIVINILETNIFLNLNYPKKEQKPR
jgi:hypothetical protein